MTSRAFSSMRARVCVLASAVALIGSLAGCGTHRQHTPQPSAWRKVMAMTGPDGEVSKEMALAAFATVYGPLPGVPPVSGERRELTSGSTALRWIAAKWQEITPEQRAAVSDAIGRDELPDDTDTGGTKGTARPLGTPGDFPNDASCPKANPGSAALRKELVGFWATLAPTLGLKTVAPNFGACVSAKQKTLSPKPGSGAGPVVVQADAWAWVAGGVPQCQITFYPAFFTSGNERFATMFHELTHCAQGLVVTPRKAYENIPAWVLEGLARWVEGKLVGHSADYAALWETYLRDTGTPLSRQSDEAMGFWWELDYRGVDVFNRFVPVVKASADVVDRRDAAAFTAALGANADDIRQSWPASYTRDAVRGAPWTTKGADITGTKATLGRPSPVADAQTGRITSGRLGVELTALDVKAEVLQFTEKGGSSPYGRFGPGTTGDFVFPQALTTVFCTLGSACTCPSDTPGAGTRFQPIAKGHAYLGITGGVNTATLEYSGTSLKAFCGPRKEKPPAGTPGAGQGPFPPGPVLGCQPPNPRPQSRPAPAGTVGRAVPLSPSAPLREGESCGTGGSNGDPHLVTFDNLRYDLQSVGEFTLARSSDDGLLVQARQKAYPGLATVSVNSALAADVAGDRVGLYLTPHPEVVEAHLNGAVVTPPAGDTALPHGGVLTKLGEGTATLYSVTWPDGRRLHVSTVGAFGLKADVVVPSSRKGRMEGLLGNFDGDPGNDLDLGGGRTLTVPAGPADLHGAYADRWRITQEASLFDYGPGESTATFTDRGFPKPVTALPGRDQAEATCRASGVTDPLVVEECVLDVALTGRPEFAAAAAAQQAFQTAVRRTETTADGTPVPPECLAAEGDVSRALFDVKIGDTIGAGGAVPCAGAMPSGSPLHELVFAGEAGQTVTLTHVPGGDCRLQWRLYQDFYDPDQPVPVPPLLGPVSVCEDLGAVTLPGSTLYAIVVENPDPAIPGTYGFTLTAG
ncbi:VWD domain-containing protein [Yinghuangia seranimata]|uniref:VWD domain-containing protein n=1 Tax=Yinghuangia seranimata TaxID=408067 RepID=UPI00248A965E|nr:VWD domain-containing protein [Yinghuangia seranimata]MDI2127727.1 VWD domain-containing protein [Yinghuangia seranimata]